MTDLDRATAPDAAARPQPRLTVRAITFGDVLEAIGDGIRDLRQAPVFGFALGLAYAAIGWFLVASVLYLDFDYYAFPMATGFALVAPFVAAGCYEVSRRLERGETPSWSAVFGAVRSGGGNDLNWMAVVTVFSYIIWIDIAFALYVIFFGLNPVPFDRLLEAVVTTGRGAVFFLVGSAVGALLSVVVFAITAISFPILFERQVDFVTAMITSVRSVRANVRPMFAWCAIIAGALAFSILSGFLALVVVLPVLGHTTWHLYRRLVAPEP